MDKRQLLTNSRISSFKSCRYKNYLEYEVGIRTTEDSKALRMGTAYHDALETLAKTGDMDAASEVINRRYAVTPEGFDASDWSYEHGTLLQLLVAYQWYWQHDPLEHLEAEHEFRLPLINPETFGPSRNWLLAGKIDGIVRLGDGRLAVLEHKLLGEDVDIDAPLWKRMRVDSQVSTYVVAARQLGFRVDAVLYNVTRKPTIKPTQVPTLDENGLKIVVDSFGERVKTKTGSWRQTADRDAFQTLLSRPMSRDEWIAKLAADIGERPSFYFARREIVRLDVDIKRFESELWDIQRTMREAQREQRWYRTSSKDTCPWCQFFEPCTNGWTPDQPVPGGFEQVYNIHQELQGVTNNGNIATA